MEVRGTDYRIFVEKSFLAFDPDLVQDPGGSKILPLKKIQMLFTSISFF